MLRNYRNSNLQIVSLVWTYVIMSTAILLEISKCFACHKKVLYFELAIFSKECHDLDLVKKTVVIQTGGVRARSSYHRKIIMNH